MGSAAPATPRGQNVAPSPSPVAHPHGQHVPLSALCGLSEFSRATSPHQVGIQPPMVPQVSGQETKCQPDSAGPPEDMKLFLETMKAQMAHMLDSMTSKLGEQSSTEEKAKLDSSSFGGSNNKALLPPTFTPDGQWQLVLKPDWQLLRSSSPLPRALGDGPEAKDPSNAFAPVSCEAGTSDLGQQWQVQAVQRSARQRAPPPRTTPLPATSSPYACDPMICHQRMEVIHVSSRGLPGASLPEDQQATDANVRGRG